MPNAQPRPAENGPRDSTPQVGAAIIVSVERMGTVGEAVRRDEKWTVMSDGYHRSMKEN